MNSGRCVPNRILTEQMLLNVSKSVGIYVFIKVRVLTESPQEWIKLSQSFPVLSLIVSDSYHTAYLLFSVFLLPHCSADLAFCLLDPTPFHLQGNAEKLRLSLSRLNIFSDS